MRNKIFLYLFIFALLYIIFQYANVKKTFEMQDNRIERLHQKVETLEHQNDSIEDENFGLKHFTLTGNDKAVAFFEDQGYDVDELAQAIESTVIGRNKADADNDLVPFAGMEGTMRINKIEILNNHWMIAEFTDSVFWGELIISYTLDDDRNLDLETKEAFLYPNKRY